MGRGSLELELKLTGAPSDVAALPQSRLLRALGGDPGVWKRLKSAYFDTADGVLAKQGIALRKRASGGVIRQTVKRATAAGAVVREEFEQDLGADAAFPAPCGDENIDALLAGISDRLVAIGEITVDRWVRLITFGQSRLELAIDLGRAAGKSGREAPIAEAEIEFVDGEMSDLFEFARLLADNAPLRLTTRTKLATAIAAEEGTLYALHKQIRPPLDGDAPAANALQALLAAIAVRVVEVQPALLDIRAIEGVHQMRVALRRFRAIERTFRKAVETDQLRALARRARDIAKALGPARDYDVFIEETMAQVFAQERDAGAPLAARAEEKRAAAWADAHERIAARDFVHFTIDLMEAGVIAPWRAALTERGAAPLTQFAPKALDKAARRAREAEAAMDRTRLAARHPLRIALKKQRYAAQMLGPLYEKARRKPYMTALSRLQESLGRVNDAVVAQRLADETGAGGGEAAMRAAGFVAGYKMAEAEAAAEEIDRGWEEFEETAPFWRDD